MMRSVALGAVAAAMAFAGMALSASAWAGPADDPANWRKVDPENLLVMTIKRQEVLVELRPDFAPAHVAQVKKITRDTNYDNLPFHRVIDDFMAQGGETYAVYQVYPRYPLMKGEFKFDRDPAKQKVVWVGKTAAGDNLGYLDGFIVQGQPDEAASILTSAKSKTWAIHCPGITSMARTNDPNSADTQFFLMRQSRTGTPDEGGLDQAYTIWGRALTGLDVIRGIKAGPEETDGRLPPAQADKLNKVQVAADLKENKRPTVYVQRTDGPEFQASLAAMTKPTDPNSACALPPVNVVVERPTS
ncbi:MAG: peptidylprolyl isomerase [Hyphomonadaceae bacterium]|nr:peptidylprolyl isomerase [Hyphomonadaceae bacterium]